MISLSIYASIAILILMKIFIYDACSLIYLTKINVKEKLVQLGLVNVSPIVKSELISEKEKYSDAKVLKENLDKKIIEEMKLERGKSIFSKDVGKGEDESIQLCLQIDATLVTDDHHAVNKALNAGLKPKTSEIILIDLLKKGIISYEDFKKYFREIAQIKVLKPEIVLFFTDKAMEIVKNNLKGG
jgi:predicted nucleic acid-binding protein